MGERRSDGECEQAFEQLAAGNDDSSIFRQIVSCFGNEMEKIARARCGACDWQDAYQDALFAAVRNAKQFRGEASVKTWLIRVTASACSKLHRGEKKQVLISNQNEALALLESQSSEPRDASTELTVHQAMACLSSALQQLPEVDRVLLTEHEVEGICLKELCERHSLSLQAAKSKLFRARSSVREHLRTRGHEI